MNTLNMSHLKDHHYITYIESSTEGVLVKPVKERSTNPLKLTHIVISGKIRTTFLGNYYIFVLFVDDIAASSSV